MNNLIVLDLIILLALGILGIWMWVTDYQIRKLEELIKKMFEAFFEDMEDEDEQDS